MKFHHDGASVYRDPETFLDDVIVVMRASDEPSLLASVVNAMDDAPFRIAFLEEVGERLISQTGENDVKR